MEPERSHPRPVAKCREHGSIVYMGQRARSRPKKHRNGVSEDRSGKIRVEGRFTPPQELSRRHSHSEEERAGCNGVARRGMPVLKPASYSQLQVSSTAAGRTVQQGSRRRPRQQQPNSGKLCKSSTSQPKNNRRQKPFQPQRTHPVEKEADITVVCCSKDHSILLTSSVDSGRGDELSSSCESSTETAQVTRSPLLMDTSQQSRRSSCSDLDDDVFEDALSSLPSEDDSIASSLFVTPLSTRSQSPTHFHHTCAQQDNSSMETVCNSLQRFLDEQRQADSTGSTLEDLEPNSSQVTVTPTSDHVSSISDHVTHHVTSLTDHVTPGPSDESMSLSSRGSEQPVFYIGDIELEMDDNKTENGALDFGFEMSAKSDIEGSCSSTSGSLSPIKPVPRRPGILGVTQASLTVNTGTNNQSFSSISTASPQSSMCSHSSHPPSPLTLSPSPTHSCEERPTQQENSRLGEITSDPPLENQTSESRTATCESSLDHLCPHQINHRDHGQCDHNQNGEEKAQEEDEWPDLCAESAQTHVEQKAVASLLHADALPDYIQWNSGVPPPCQTGYSCILPVSPNANGGSPLYHGAYWPVFTPHTTANPTYFPPTGSCSPGCFHPLHDAWVMWYDKITGNTRNQMSDYKASLNQLYTVGYVEDFWRLYNNIRLPSELDRNANYHFFKHPIQPLWEDPANRHGGKWVLTIREDTDVLDKTWMELLMALIGDQMNCSNLVNGAVVSRRKKGDRIALWTKKRNKKANIDICKEFVRALALACEVSAMDLRQFAYQLAEERNGLSLVYMHHADSLKSGHSYQNDARMSLRDHLESILESL